MTILNEKKVRWIICEVERGRSVSGIARTQKVSRRWVNELYRRYREMGEASDLGKPGRPASPPSQDVVGLVLRYHETYDMGAAPVRRTPRGLSARLAFVLIRPRFGASQRPPPEEWNEGTDPRTSLGAVTP